MLKPSIRSIWSQAKELLRRDVPDHGFESWIEPLTLVTEKEDAVVLGCSTRFARKWLLENYRELLENALVQAASRPMALAIEVLRTDRPSEDSEKELPPPEKIPPLPRQLTLPGMGGRAEAGRMLSRNFTFDSFVVGACNDFAYTAALSLAARKGNHAAPLFLLSKTGLGKSHLSQAVGRYILDQSPGDRVYYITAEDFTGEMVDSLQNSRMNRFKEKYRKKTDVLILEDVQFLSGKERTQKELAYTLDSLMDMGKRLVFTSTHLPTEIPKLHETVHSRLSSGVVSIMDAPDFSTRVKILKKKANGNPIPGEVIELLASELTGNVRLLESGLRGVMARSSLMGRTIDQSLAREVIQGIAVRKNELTLGAIKGLVCKYYQVTEEDLGSRSRKQRVARPRQVAMYLGRRYTDQSLQAIARSFNRYHATTLHAIAAVEKHLRVRDDVSRQVEFLCEKLESGDF